MLNLRPLVARAVEPLASGLLALGVGPDAVTVAGTLGTVAASLVLLPRGHFVVGGLVVGACVLTDVLDGTMARRRGPSGPWGAFLDSTLDRVSDGAVLSGVALWYAGPGASRLLVAVALVGLVAGSVTSYAKARAQSLGMTCDVGLLERTERLILVLVGVLLTGIGIAPALPVALWLLAAGSVVTVGQRLHEVRRQAVAR